MDIIIIDKKASSNFINVSLKKNFKKKKDSNYKIW